MCKLLALFALVLHDCDFPPRESFKIPGDLLDFIATLGRGLKDEEVSGREQVEFREVVKPS